MHHSCCEDIALLERNLREVREALFAEAKGVACSEGCAGPGYRKCSGCDARVKKALGLRPDQSIYDFDKVAPFIPKSTPYDTSGSRGEPETPA